MTSIVFLDKEEATSTLKKKAWQLVNEEEPFHNDCRRCTYPRSVERGWTGPINRAIIRRFDQFSPESKFTAQSANVSAVRVKRAIMIM